MFQFRSLLMAVWLGALALTSVCAQDEATAQRIRQNLHQRMPELPAVDEVRKSPLPGLYELRFGNEIMYSDAEADHLVQGDIVDTRAKVNLTQERVNHLAAMDFTPANFKDALMWKKGQGQRRLVVFADPFCTYCKALEQELQKLDNVTVYTFLVPVISQESPNRIRDIWCSADPVSAWRAWMLTDATPRRAMGSCEPPLKSNLSLYEHFGLRATPVLFFEDGSRNPGAMAAQELQRRLAQIEIERKH